MGLIWDAQRARAVDLISLPPGLCGTSCGSCRYFQFEPKSPDRNIGYCAHHLVRMNVDAHFCCYYWANSRAPLASPALARRRYAKSMKS